jgi:hypothetical protein
MIRLEVQSDLPALVSKIKNLREDQLPFAIASAVTKTAQAAKYALVVAMPFTFDRPTPYTLGSLYLSPATKSLPIAKIWIKDDAGKGTPAAKYLLPEIAGGQRNLKRFERRLQLMGLLPAGMYAVPGEGATLDAYGNISASTIEQILSALGAAEIYSGYKANRTAASRARKGRRIAEYFVGKPGGAPLGVYRRYGFAHGSAVKPILIFVRSPVYRPRYDFQEIAEKVVRDQFPRQFSEAYQRAVATAR